MPHAEELKTAKSSKIPAAKDWDLCMNTMSSKRLLTGVERYQELE